MRRIGQIVGVILVYLFAAVCCGSLLAWVLQWILPDLLQDVEYNKLLSRSILLCVALGLVPLWRWAGLSAEHIGLRPVQLAGLWQSYILGIFIALPLLLFYLVVGFRVIDPRVDFLGLAFIGSTVGIFLSAWLVGVFEETLFRGVLFTSLRHSTNFVVSACFTAVLYSAVHFFDADYAATVLAQGQTTGEGASIAVSEWYSGFLYVGYAFHGFVDPAAYWDSFLALFLLGLLFAYVREHHGLWPCIALHAAWVFVIRTFKESTVRDVVNPYIGWVGNYDNFVGHLVSVWLVFAFLVIYLMRLHRSGRLYPRHNN